MPRDPDTLGNVMFAALGVVILVGLGVHTDWTTTAGEALTALACAGIALVTVAVWDRATRRRRD